MNLGRSGDVTVTNVFEIQNDGVTNAKGAIATIKKSNLFDPGEGPGIEAYHIDMPEDGSVIAPHFHVLDQFQVFIDGSCSLGKKDLGPVGVHYVDAFSPYGPIASGKEGMRFFTLRLQGDVGPYYMPKSRALKTRRARRNLIVTSPAKTRVQPADGVEVLMAPHADGLAVYRLAGTPGQQVKIPDPAIGGGQYILILEGSAEWLGESYPVRSCIFVSPDESASRLIAGKKGFEAVIAQFPRQSWQARAEKPVPLA